MKFSANTALNFVPLTFDFTIEKVLQIVIGVMRKNALQHTIVKRGTGKEYDPISCAGVIVDRRK